MAFVLKRNTNFRALLKGPVNSNIETVAKLANYKLSTAIKERRRGDKWDERYSDLCEYKKKHGNCIVRRGPKVSNDTKKLGRWVTNQRQHFTLLQRGLNSPLTRERIQLLDKIGFVWNVHIHSWETRIKELKEFKQKHGHCNVSRNYEDRELFIWVCLQRQQYKLRQDGKDSDMTLERIKRLEEIGFIWKVQEHQWDAKFKEFADYQKATGVTFFSKTNENVNDSLLHWSKTQRSQYLRLLAGKSSRLTQHRKKRLDSINFQFVSHRTKKYLKDSWDHCYKILQDHLKLDTTIKMIPTSSVRLWLSNQLRFYALYKRGKKPKEISRAQIKLLEYINISKIQPYYYDPMYYELTKFKMEYGSSYVPFTVNSKLHLWQKQIIRKLTYNPSSLYINEVHALRNYFSISESKEWYSMLYQCEEYLDKAAKAAKHSAPEFKEQRNYYELLEWIQKTTALYDRSPEKFSEEQIRLMDEVGLITVEDEQDEIDDYVSEDTAVSAKDVSVYGKENTTKELVLTDYSIAAKMKLDSQSTSEVNEEKYWEAMFVQFQNSKQRPVSSTNYDDSDESTSTKTQQTTYVTSKNPELLAWESEQRKEYMLHQKDFTSNLNTERIEKLESLGFIWDVEEEIWMKKYGELVEYTQKTGHCYVPHWYPSNPSLGHWVHSQMKELQVWKRRRNVDKDSEGDDSKEEKGKSKLTKERIQLLKDIGLST